MSTFAGCVRRLNLTRRSRPASSPSGGQATGSKAEMFQSIRWRIAFPSALFFLLLMLGLGFSLARFFRQSELNELERELTAESSLLADILSGQMASAGEIQDFDA